MSILDGFKLDLHATPSVVAPPSVLRAAECLESLPANELISSGQLEDALGLHRGYLRDYGGHALLRDNRIRVPRVNGTLWGSKKAIEEVRRRKYKAEQESQRRVNAKG